jgi:hypothetical protein
MRWKLFFKLFAITLPIAFVGKILTQIGNELRWNWIRWHETMTLVNIGSAIIVGAILAAIWLHVLPNDRPTEE